MKTVLKYPIRCFGAPEVQKVWMPDGAQLLTVASQPVGEFEKVFLWAWVDTDQEETCRQIVVLGTGQPLAVYRGFLRYIGTFFLNEHISVGHAFEVIATERMAIGAERDECEDLQVAS